MKTIVSKASLRNSLALTSALLVLSACGGTSHSDLRQFVASTQQQALKGSRVEPLPDIKPYETFLYKVASKRDPFTPSHAADTVLADTTTDGIRPDPNRRREALESYPLDSLRMVGTMQQQELTWAVVQVINDPDGGIHRISLGNYMGQNHGRVVGINEEQIELIEIVPNGLGGWRERELSVALSEE